MIMFQFEVPKSSLYNDAGSKNYDDKIKVFVHDINAQVRMLLQALLNTKFVTSLLIILSCNWGQFWSIFQLMEFYYIHFPFLPFLGISKNFVLTILVTFYGKH